jgi:alanyl-tRNA synthetase
MHCAEIRQKFVEYYRSLGFQLLPRAPMLHPSIPMSFVMSAGLVQVETSLANSKNRPGDKFVLVQNCFRHFDLHAIGKDHAHLSLFEMPGAFMFGRNSHFDVVRQMWTLATDVLNIHPDQLWATYFAGDTLGSQRLPSDQETYEAWGSIGIAEDHLIGLGANDNYWIQGGGMQHKPGSSRKCGPNTELFFDRGKKYSCSARCQPGCRCGQRFLEFSNSLFISFNLHSQAHGLFPLDDPFTETVIGTERVAMILQEAPSVFATTFYQPIIATIHSFVTRHDLPVEQIRESERVIADHLRALYVLVSDGAPPPGKNGRERIIKLLIRGVLTRQMLLGITSPDFLDAVLWTIVASMGSDNGFQRLTASTLLRIHQYIRSESDRFEKTVQRGLQTMQAILAKNHRRALSGEQILRLEKGMGLPLPIIVDQLQKHGIAFEETDYALTLKSWRNPDAISETTAYGTRQ